MSDPHDRDTYRDPLVESGIPFCPPDVSAPDSRGFSAPDADFATGSILHSGGGNFTRASGVGAGGGGGGGGDAIGGTP